jgi:hypothetical protein
MCQSQLWKDVRITRTARKHRIGVAHIRYVMEQCEPWEDGDALVYVGVDDRGVLLEIVAVPDDHKEHGLAVIHAMPARYRGGADEQANR